MPQNQARRTVLKTIGSAGAVLAVGGTGIASAEPPSEGDTIVDVAADAGFDVLVAAVKEAGLVDTLSGNRQLTAFAPTDAAFEAAGITVDSVDEVDNAFLRNVLTYHVTPGRRKARSVVSASKLPTLNGTRIAVDGRDLNGDQADIVTTDVEASNGIVHVIDGVLLP